MRVGYLIIGLLLGMFYTTGIALRVCEVKDQEFEREFLAAVLTGYSEGWTRGRDYTYNLVYWRWTDCADELNRVGEGK